MNDLQNMPLRELLKAYRSAAFCSAGEKDWKSHVKNCDEIEAEILRRWNEANENSRQ